MVIFPHVKITCYLHMFLHKSLPGISLMFIAKEQPLEDTRLWGGSLIQPCTIVPGAEKISNWCNSHNGNVRIQRKKNKRTKNVLFLKERVIQNRESTSHLRACESHVHPVFNQSLGEKIYLHHMGIAAHLCAEMFYFLTKSLQLILKSLQPTDYFRYLLAETCNWLDNRRKDCIWMKA